MYFYNCWSYDQCSFKSPRISLSANNLRHTVKAQQAISEYQGRKCPHPFVLPPPGLGDGKANGRPNGERRNGYASKGFEQRRSLGRILRREPTLTRPIEWRMIGHSKGDGPVPSSPGWTEGLAVSLLPSRKSIGKLAGSVRPAATKHLTWQ
jgi:hypothetical protein